MKENESNIKCNIDKDIKYSNKISIRKINSNIPFYLDKEIIIGGWIREVKVKPKSNFSLIEVYDGTYIKPITVIIKKETNEKKESENNDVDYNEILTTENIGNALMLKGKLVLNPYKHTNNIEYNNINTLLTISDIEISVQSPLTNIKLYGKCEKQILSLIKSKEKVDFNTLLNIPHLRPRTKLVGSITRIRNTINYTIQTFMQKEGVFSINTPIITSFNYPISFCEDSHQFQVTTIYKNKDNDNKTKERKRKYSVNSKNNSNDQETFEFISMLKRLENESYFDGEDYNRNIQLAYCYLKNYYKSNELFRKETYLNNTTVIHLMSYCLSLGSVYSFGPVFRREEKHEDDVNLILKNSGSNNNNINYKSNKEKERESMNIQRHLSEFWLIEGLNCKLYIL